jgi:hypothetical protein
MYMYVYVCIYDIYIYHIYVYDCARRMSNDGVRALSVRGCQPRVCMAVQACACAASPLQALAVVRTALTPGQAHRPSSQQQQQQPRQQQQQQQQQPRQQQQASGSRVAPPPATSGRPPSPSAASNNSNGAQPMSWRELAELVSRTLTWRGRMCFVCV